MGKPLRKARPEIQPLFRGLYIGVLEGVRRNWKNSCNKVGVDFIITFIRLIPKIISTLRSCLAITYFSILFFRKDFCSVNIERSKPMDTNSKVFFAFLEIRFRKS